MWKIIKFFRSCGTKILFKDCVGGEEDISRWLNKTSLSYAFWTTITCHPTMDKRDKSASVGDWDPGRSLKPSAVQYGEEPFLDCRLACRWLSHWCPGSSSMPLRTGIWLSLSPVTSTIHQGDLAGIMPIYGSGNGCIGLKVLAIACEPAPTLDHSLTPWE